MKTKKGLQFKPPIFEPVTKLARFFLSKYTLKKIRIIKLD